MIDNFVEFSNSHPLVIVTEETTLAIRIQLQTTDFLQLREIRLFDRFGSPITDAKLIESSSYFGDNVKNSPEYILEGTRGFSTKREKNPELLISFSQMIDLGRIEIYNRGKSPRSFSIKIEIQDDSRNWSLVYDNWSCYKKKLESSLTLREQVFLAATYFDFANLKKKLAVLKKKISASEYIEIREQINKFFFLRGLELTNHGIAKTFRFYTKAEILSNLKLLLSLFSTLDKSGLGTCFITSGTLLGMYRDGHPILHDDDYDAVIVLNKINEGGLRVAKEKVRQVLIDNGWNANLVKGNVNLRVGYKGVSFDLFLAWEDNEFIHVTPLEKFSLKSNDIIPLKSISYDSVNLPVPSNIEKFLEVNYGIHWDKPDSGWKFDWNRAFSEYKEILI